MKRKQITALLLTAVLGAGSFKFQKPIKPNGGISMNQMSLEQELKSNAYPGRGIVLGRTADRTP